MNLADLTVTQCAACNAVQINPISLTFFFPLAVERAICWIVSPPWVALLPMTSPAVCPVTEARSLPEG